MDRGGRVTGLAVWLPIALALLGAVAVSGRWLARILLAVVHGLEGVGELSKTFGAWTEDMRTWQRKTDDRLVRLETIEETRR